MANVKTVIQEAYSAFNKRDIDGALALMTEDVSWPKASEGSKVVGKEEIRSSHMTIIKSLSFLSRLRQPRNNGSKFIEYLVPAL